MTKTLKTLSIFFILSTLSACATPSESASQHHQKLGYANHLNISAQSISPDPKLKENTYIPADPDRVRAAREAYKNGEVKALLIESGLSD